MLLVAEDRIRSALASGLGDIDMSSAKSVSKGKGKDRTKEVSAKHDSPTPPEK
jgi:hypothetical protein